MARQLSAVSLLTPTRPFPPLDTTAQPPELIEVKAPAGGSGGGGSAGSLHLPEVQQAMHGTADAMASKLADGGAAACGFMWWLLVVGCCCWLLLL